MAITAISDVIVPEVFFSYLQEEDLNVNRLIQASPAVVSDPMVAAGLAGGGKIFSIPGWKSTENDADSVTTDDATAITPSAITGRKQDAVRLERANAWSSADLVAQLAGSDPMAHAATKVGQVRNSRRQVAMINTLNGLFDASGSLEATHLNDVAEKTTVGSAAASTSIAASVVIDSAEPFGDMWNPSEYTLVVHGDTYRLLQKQNLITFQPTAAQDIGFGTYLGMTLVVDDGLPKTVFDTTGLWYRSYLLGPESVTVTVGQPRIPVEVEREALQGTGGGVESLVVRDTYVVHPYGLRFTSTTVAGETPSNTEMATVANWVKVWEDKAIKVAAIDHNNIAA